MNPDQEIVLKEFPGAVIKYHAGEDVFALYEGESRLSGYYEWRSDCWAGVARRIRDTRAGVRRIGAIGCGELQ